jgi:hypothetical protein
VIYGVVWSKVAHYYHQGQSEKADQLRCSVLFGARLHITTTIDNKPNFKLEATLYRLKHAALPYWPALWCVSKD